MRLRGSLAVLACVALAAGCGRSPFVRLTVQLAGQAEVSQLRLEVTLGAMSDGFAAPAQAGAALAFPTTLGIALPGGTRGQLAVHADALDGKGRTLGGGDTAVAIASDAVVDASLVIALQCTDGVRDGDETGIDCGGGCPPCSAGMPCSTGSGCDTGSCVMGHCQLATSPPSWLPAPALPAPRQALGAATSPDGTIWAITGDDAGGSGVATVTTLAPGASNWQAAPDARGPREAPGVAAGPDGKIYAAGGFEDTVSLDRLDPSDGSWAPLADLPTGRGNLAVAVTADGQLFAIGGGIGANFYTTVEVLPIAGGSWASAPSLGTARYGGAAAVGPDGRVYAFGGYSGARLASAEAFVPTPAAMAWTNVASMVTERRFLGGALGGDGRIYAIGGEANGGAIAQVEAYAADQDRWVPVAPLAAPRDAMAVALGGDGRLYAIGGRDVGGSTVATVEAYGPVLVLSPDHGPAGGSARLSGMNFAANAPVAIYFGSMSVASAQTDAAGALPDTQLTVPSLAAGSYPVRAIDSRSRYPAIAAYQIK